MRPITKKVPVDKDGNKLKFKAWGEAKPHLIKQTCRYCHFCEMPILNIPAVEHIKPKECDGNKYKYINLRNEWSNLLLICHYCNSTKGNRDIKLNNYYWPHKNNTLVAFEHLSGVLVPGSTLNPHQKAKAKRTIEIYGLHKKIDSSGGIDTRFEHRLKTISQALERYNEYKNIPQLVTPDAVIGQAESTGFWSVWYNIFSSELPIKEALIRKFKAAQDCFDSSFDPIHRNPNSPIDTI